MRTTTSLRKGSLSPHNKQIQPNSSMIPLGIFQDTMITRMLWWCVTTSMSRSSHLTGTSRYAHWQTPLLNGKTSSAPRSFQ
ncbi:hypothetical protein D6C95_09899 [Aureobasidium pullulans]|nr:hypothetical protein D6C95_09899 [Aureobasidium pullulans]